MSQVKSRQQPGEPSVILLFLWALVCLAMWFWAIVGPLFVVLGALSFFLDLGAFGIDISGFGGEPVRTTGQKLTFMAVGAIGAIVGIAFLWLRRCGWLRYGPPEDRPPRLKPEVDQAARARFTSGQPPADADAIRPAEDGVRGSEDA
jgi:hypothetical protein